MGQKINIPAALSGFAFATLTELKAMKFEALTMPCRPQEYHIIFSIVKTLMGARPFRLYLTDRHNGRKAPEGTVEVWVKAYGQG